jgi:hypothetical protein
MEWVGGEKQLLLLQKRGGMHELLRHRDRQRQRGDCQLTACRPLPCSLSSISLSQLHQACMPTLPPRNTRLPAQHVYFAAAAMTRQLHISPWSAQPSTPKGNHSWMTSARWWDQLGTAHAHGQHSAGEGGLTPCWGTHGGEAKLQLGMSGPSPTSSS